MGRFQEIQRQEQAVIHVQEEEANEALLQENLLEEQPEEVFDQPEEVQEAAPAPAMEEPVQQQGVNRKEEKHVRRKEQAVQRQAAQAEQQRRRAEQNRQEAEQRQRRAEEEIRRKELRKQEKRRIEQAKREAKERLKRRKWELERERLAEQGLDAAGHMSRKHHQIHMRDVKVEVFQTYENTWREKMVLLTGIQQTLKRHEIDRGDGKGIFKESFALQKKLDEISAQVGDTLSLAVVEERDLKRVNRALRSLERIGRDAEGLKRDALRLIERPEQREFQRELNDQCIQLYRHLFPHH